VAESSLKRGPVSRVGCDNRVVGDGDIDDRLDRQTRVLDAMVGRLEDLATEIREHRAEAREHRAEAREHRAEAREQWRELRAESRAHTEALFRLMDRIDRIEPGGSAA
jgi:chromosome segregation ATPase